MIKPMMADDGKEYYVAYCAEWVWQALDPWPNIYRSARRHLASIGA